MSKAKSKVEFYNNGVPANVEAVKTMDAQTVIRLGVLNLNKYATLAGVTSDGLGEAWSAFRDGFHAIKKTALAIGMEALLSAETVSITGGYSVSTKGKVRTSGRIVGRGLSEGVLHDKATLESESHKAAVDKWAKELCTGTGKDGKPRSVRVLATETAENAMFLPVSKAIGHLIAGHKSLIPVAFLDGNKVKRKDFREYLLAQEIKVIALIKREKKAKEKAKGERKTPAEVKAERSATRAAAVVEEKVA